jgi:hypothetical protein
MNVVRQPRSARAGALTRPSLVRDSVLLGIAALVLVVLMDLYVRDSPSPRNDELIYELMARSPFAPHTFPFAYRFGVPTLVHLLPFGHTASFSALAWLSSAACAPLGYLLLRRFSVDRWLSASLALLMAVSPVLFVVSLHQGRNVDPESIAILLAGTIAIVDRRPVALGAIAFGGVFVRETALFLLPFAYAVWANRLWDRQAIKTVVLASAPAVMAYAAMRLWIPAVYRDQVVGYDSLIGGRREILSKASANWKEDVRRMASAFGPLWLTFPFALKESAFVRRGLVLVACCLVSMLFALDWGRMIFMALPVFLVGGGIVLQPRPRLAVLAVGTLAFLCFGYAIYMEDFGGAQNGIIDVGHASYPLR